MSVIGENRTGTETETGMQTKMQVVIAVTAIAIGPVTEMATGTGTEGETTIHGRDTTMATPMTTLVLKGDSKQVKLFYHFLACCA
jgi:hypothetical protein